VEKNGRKKPFGEVTRPRGGETGHEDVEIGVHGDVFLLVLIVDFHEVVVDDGHVTNIQVSVSRKRWKA